MQLMQLTDYFDWQSAFDRTVLENGRDLYDAGKAKKLTVDEEETALTFRATVRTERNYRPVLRIDQAKGKIDLTCDCEESKKRYCVHMAALFFMAEDYVSQIPDLNELLDNAAGAAERQEEQHAADTIVEGQVARKMKNADNGTLPGEKNDSSLDALNDLIKSSQAAEDESDRRSDAAMISNDAYRYFRADLLEADAHLSIQLRRKAERLIRREQPEGISLSFGYEGPADGQMVGTGELTARDGSWKAKIVFDRTRLLGMRCSGWRCGHSYDPGAFRHGDICEHEAAVLLMTVQALREHAYGDATDLAAARFLDQSIAGSAGVLENAPGEGTGVQQTILPRATIEDNSMELSFRFGDCGKASRFYKVKNIPEFLQEMKEGAVHRFGKNYETRLLADQLDENGRLWYGFMRDMVEDEEMHASHYPDRQTRFGSFYDPYRRMNFTDSLPLYGFWLDRFYRSLEEQHLEIEAIDVSNHEEKRSMHLSASGSYFQPELTVSPLKEGKEFAGVKVSGDLPHAIMGQDSAYCIRDGVISRMNPESFRSLSPLTQHSESGHFEARIGRLHLADFYHKALPNLKKSMTVSEKRKEEILPYLPPESQIVFYLDIVYGVPVARVTAGYGSRTEDVADLLTERTPESYRDQEKERLALNTVMRYLPKYDTVRNLFFGPDEDDLYRLLSSGVDALLSVGEVRSTERFKRLGVTRHMQMNIGVSLENNLLDLNVSSPDISEQELLELLLTYQLKKKKYYRLKSGSFISLEEDPENTVTRLAEMMDALQLTPREFVRGHMNLPAYRALYIDRMMEEMDSVYADRDAHFRALIRGFRTVSDAEDPVPAGLAASLRRYQETGFRWMRMLDRNGFGGILADEMGLGKTIQMIAVLLAERESGGPRTVSIVVCPAALVYNWEAEIHRFAPGLTAVTVTGTQQERRTLLAYVEEAAANAVPPDMLITSFDLLKRDIDSYEKIRFRYAVVDEAQYIKNSRTAAAKSVKLLKAAARFALTGTPIENRLSELWSIFDFLMPGFLYGYDTFRSTFEAPIVKNEDEEAKTQLSRMVTPFILRRKKSDVLKDLPDKIEEIRYAGLGKEQQKLYDAEVVLLKKQLEGQSEEEFRRGKIQVLAELTRIRQICCDPALCFEEYRGGSAKREACIELIRSCADGGHKALVFSQFTSMLELLEKDLEKEGLPCYKITGQTPKEKRLELVEAFNSDDVPVFLISLKAGGTGLNLTGADIVIHYDPWWNFAVQNQATDRAHRIGQKRVVSVYRIIARGTIEEKIVDMQEAKRKLSDDVLNEEGVSSAALDRDELLKLLS